MPRKNRRKPVERIQVSKNDEIALVVERIIDAEAEEVVLTIPRFSRLAESGANFHLIKREADLLEKRVVIESVDDKAIELAQSVGLDSLNPILVKRKQFSDIVSAPSPSATEEEPMMEKVPEGTSEEVSKVTPTSEEEVPEKKFAKKLKIKFPRPKLPRIKPRLPGKRSIITLAIAILVVIISVSILRVIPKVEVKIVTAKTSWDFNDSIALKKSEGTTQVFRDTRNLNVSFPASGVDKIEKHARGTITVYNAYSSDSQPLVRRTRFVTPDGKVFRLTKGITVPAAKVVEGEIIPSSIEAEVIADEPGEDHNTGPVDYYSVPGFKGTAKYKGFYGESEGSMTGGLVGEVAVPTEGDIRAAKDNVAERIEEVLSASLLGSLPEDFVIIDGATDFQITKQNVITDTDSQGNFSVFAEAEMDVVGFKELDVLEVATAKMREDLGETYEFESFTISYGQSETDFDSGTITFPVQFSGVAHQPVDADSLRIKILGQSEEDLKVLISSLPGFEDGRVSFWPFWVKEVPTRPNRVRIDIL